MSAAAQRVDGREPDPWPWKPTRALDELLPDLVRFFEGEQRVDAQLGADLVDAYWTWRCECACGLGRALERISGR